MRLDAIYLRYFFSKYTYILQKSKFTANNCQKRPLDVGESCVCDPYLLQTYILAKSKYTYFKSTLGIYIVACAHLSIYTARPTSW